MLEQQSIRRARAEVVTMGGRRWRDRGDGMVVVEGKVVVVCGINGDKVD